MFFGAYFAAGTPLFDARRVAVAIEGVVLSDLVLTRNQDDPAGVVEPKAVEEVFVREALVWHLHAGGRVVRTTAEHPFYTADRGWVECHQLRVGDWLLTEAGRWVQVEDLLDTGELEAVYNLRVSDHHTYFVGEELSSALWAHNADYNALPASVSGADKSINTHLNQYNQQGIGDCVSHSLDLQTELAAAGAVLRNPTGPGMHTVVLLPKDGLVVDVTASQFVPAASNPGVVSQQFQQPLYQTGVWTIEEFNAFLQSINPLWHL